VTALNSWHIACAVRALRRGGVIAYPTEGVWGLGCDPHNQAAVRRLLALKGREPAKGLILVAAAIEQVQPLLDALPVARRVAVLQSWPGAVTWILPTTPGIPRWITGKHSGVAVRVSDHLQLAALCKGFGAPIVSTSANPQGRPAARNVLAVRRYFRARLDYILPGRLGGRTRPSEIRDASNGRILRPG
jgi:L-threonylcarbamoyladenylate synthase